MSAAVAPANPMPSASDSSALLVLTPRMAELYTVDYLLGRGGFGAVWAVTENANGWLWAIKEIRYGGKSGLSREDVQRELEISIAIKHQNLLLATDFDEDEAGQRFLLVSQFCSGGSLQGLIDQGTIFPERRIWKIGRQLLEGLKYMHSGAGDRYTCIIHRDIKPDNLLLEGERLLIADFGLARRIDRDGLTTSGVGTLQYMAPEVVGEEEYGAEVDLWSVGCLLFQLATGTLPYSDRTIKSRFADVKRLTPRINKKLYSKTLQTTIDTLLSIKAEGRGTIDDLLELYEMQLAGMEVDFEMHRYNTQISLDLQAMQNAENFRINTEIAQYNTQQAQHNADRGLELDIREAMFRTNEAPACRCATAHSPAGPKRKASNASLSSAGDSPKRTCGGVEGSETESVEQPEVVEETIHEAETVDGLLA